ncbi:MAG: hypothetical protein J0L77_09600 [Alphaproteobacteria bacterium]|nr:hypothetical protein [Alphaproteobacteria bacterium]
MIQENPKLKAAFANTNTIEYGGFKIVKSGDMPWDKARVYVDGQQIILNMTETRSLALLVAYRGEFVPKEAHGFDNARNKEVRIAGVINSIKKSAKNQLGLDIYSRFVTFYPRKKDFPDWDSYAARLGNYKII